MTSVDRAISAGGNETRATGVKPIVKRLAILLLSATLVAACSGSSHKAEPPSSVVGADAVITGRMHVVGGPAPGIDNPAPGTILVRRAGGSSVVTQARTDSTGRFHVSVAAGTYVVEGMPRDPSAKERPTERVVAKRGQTMSVDLVLAVA